MTRDGSIAVKCCRKIQVFEYFNISGGVQGLLTNG